MTAVLKLVLTVVESVTTDVHDCEHRNGEASVSCRHPGQQPVDLTIVRDMVYKLVCK